jgi:hypothetical protein
MILWQLGKPEMWEHMIKERTRLFKERAEAQLAEDKRQLEHKKKMADMFIFALYFIAGSAIVFCITMGSIAVYGAVEEKRIYEEKVAKRLLILRQQQQERDKKERAERDKAVGGG